MLKKIYLFYKVIDPFDYVEASRFTKNQRLYFSPHVKNNLENNKANSVELALLFILFNLNGF